MNIEAIEAALNDLTVPVRELLDKAREEYNRADDAWTNASEDVREAERYNASDATLDELYDVSAAASARHTEAEEALSRIEDILTFLESR